ncbi:MAG: hypothetical protein PHY72_04020 [Candidatus Pacebacteria bacterium]|nr:hypothetical protein [Candidatus Paceibacterota bacterium]
MKKSICFVVVFFFSLLTLTASPLFAAGYPHATLIILRGNIEVEEHNIPVAHSGDIIIIELDGFSDFSFVSFIQRDLSGGPVERMVDGSKILKATRQNHLIFLEVLSVAEPTMSSFNFGGAEFSGRLAPSLIYNGQVVASGLLVLPAPTCSNQCNPGDKMGTSDTTYKFCVINPSTGCTVWSPIEFACPYGTVFCSGSCINATPPPPPVGILEQTGSIYTKNNEGYKAEVEFTLGVAKPFSYVSFFVEGAKIKEVKYGGKCSFISVSLDGKNAMVNLNNNAPVGGKVFVVVEGTAPCVLKYFLNGAKFGEIIFPPEHPAGGDLVMGAPAKKAFKKLPATWGSIKK